MIKWLFKTGIYSSDPARRMKAVEKLDIIRGDYNRLIKIIKNDEIPEIRLAALNKFHRGGHFDILAEVVENEDDSSVRLRAIQMIIEDFNAKDYFPLVLLEEKRVDLCKALVENGLNIYARKHDGESYLSMAIRKERRSIIDLLINHDPDLRSISADNAIALITLGYFNYKNISKQIIQVFVQKNSTDSIDRIIKPLLDNAKNAKAKLNDDFKEIITESFSEKIELELSSEEDKIATLLTQISTVLWEKRKEEIKSKFTEFKVDRSVERSLDELLVSLQTCLMQKVLALSAEGAQFAITTSGQQVQLPNTGLNEIESQLSRIDYRLNNLEPSASWILINRIMTHNYSANESHTAKLGLNRIFANKVGIEIPEHAMRYWVERYFNS